MAVVQSSEEGEPSSSGRRQLVAASSTPRAALRSVGRGRARSSVLARRRNCCIIMWVVGAGEHLSQGCGAASPFDTHKCSTTGRTLPSHLGKRPVHEQLPATWMCREASRGQHGISRLPIHRHIKISQKLLWGQGEDGGRAVCLGWLHDAAQPTQPCKASQPAPHEHRVEVALFEICVGGASTPKGHPLCAAPCWPPGPLHAHTTCRLGS